jgi:GT2 family glycosyltransferase
MYKIFYAVPNLNGYLAEDVIKGFMDQLSWAIKTKNLIQYASTKNTLIYNARNQLANLAVEGGYTHIFFNDSDVIIPPDTLEKLIKIDKPIVSGVYYCKTPPKHWPVVLKNKSGIWEYWVNHPNHIFEADGVGMGCCLIKTDVIKALGKQCFNPTTELTGEDMAFCQRATQKGFKIYVDPSVQCAHITNYYVTQQDYELALSRFDKTTQPKVEEKEI